MQNKAVLCFAFLHLARDFEVLQLQLEGLLFGDGDAVRVVGDVAHMPEGEHCVLLDVGLLFYDEVQVLLAQNAARYTHKQVDLARLVQLLQQVDLVLLELRQLLRFYLLAPNSTGEEQQFAPHLGGDRLLFQVLEKL